VSQRDGTVSVGGREIFYRTTDQTSVAAETPATIVFHHGIAADGDLWNGWLPVLSDRYRLVRLDMYGCRHSPAPDSPDYGADWPVTARVADLMAVIDATTEGPVHLVGESYGGTICLAAALDHPGRVASITCMNTAHVGASVENVAHWKTILDDVGVEGWSDFMMEARFAEDALTDAQWTWFSQRQRGHSHNVILHILQSLLDIDLLPRLGGLSAPALLMNGDRSPFVSVALMQDLCDRLPDARLRIFPGVKHGLPFANAAGCANELRGFLDERF
jgi:pimeloyl-ACP methyl ester carboxylesterase